LDNFLAGWGEILALLTHCPSAKKIPMPPVLSCESLVCHRPQWAKGRSSQVEDVSLSLEAGTLTSFHGPDGCGKGLLLNLLGLLETPDAGMIRVCDHEPLTMTAEELCEFRNERFGFIFDAPCLLPAFSVAENVAMPLFRICGGDARSARARTMEVLEFVGLGDEESTLSGRLDDAAQGRVALARALAHRPEILIGIAPRYARELIPLVREATREFGLCVLWADEAPIPGADDCYALQSGRLHAAALS